MNIMSTWMQGEMLAAVRTLPQQLIDGSGFVGDVGKEASGVKRVIVCGLGGSAFPAELLRLYTDALGVDLTVSRDYVVRDHRVDAQCLVIVSSFSGNTEETVSALHDARSRGAQIVVMSAGGKLAIEAAKHALPYVAIAKPTPDFQPRAASGYFISALAAVLDNAGLLTGGADAMAAAGGALAKALQTEEPAMIERALALAERLRGRIPILYATAPFGVVAKVVKIKLNENSKTPAFFYEIPEFNHNEMVGFTRLPAPFSAVILDDPGAPARLAHRVNVTADTLADNGVPVERVALPDAGNDIVKAFQTLLFFDYVSCALAALDGIDPNPVAMVEDFKRRLG
ncbi:MAG: glucose/mannose-6-phosphate isomerase [Bradymonadia bacterium]|jgi:glucose/mannose-6-phosphate isomerase